MPLAKNNKKNNIAVITIDCNYLDWIKKHPSLFLGNLSSRVESEETDPWPGHRRWHGDGVPGTQVVFVGNSDYPAIIVAGHNATGRVLGTVDCSLANSNNEEILKQLAYSNGYILKKRKTVKRKPRKKKSWR
jgi:hypothetical protein